MKLMTFAIALAAAAAAGATIAPGDVATANVICPSNGCGRQPTYLFTSTPDLKATLPSYGAITFGPGNQLYVVTLEGTPVDIYDAALAKRSVDLTPTPVLPAGVAVAANGDLVILGGDDNTLHVYAPDGTPKRAYVAATALAYEASLDLAPDQCTVFWTDGDGPRRFDICNGRPLPPMPIHGWPTAVRALSDGGYLVAEPGALQIFDASDHLVRTQPADIDQPIAIAFDSDPRYLWVAQSHSVVKVRIADGVRAATMGGALRVAVNGEQRPSTAAAATAIPALSPPLLFALAAGLIALAWQRLRA